jgi:hypothetical protein
MKGPVASRRQVDNCTEGAFEYARFGFGAIGLATPTTHCPTVLPRPVNFNSPPTPRYLKGRI